MPSQKMIELVPVEIDEVLNECNRVQVLIELKRKEMLDNEVERIASIFHITSKQACYLIESAASENAKFYSYKEAIYNKLEALIEKALECKKEKKQFMNLEKNIMKTIRDLDFF
jgi:hypothetical protein